MNMDIGNKAAQFDFWEYIIRILFAVYLSITIRHKTVEELQSYSCDNTAKNHYRKFKTNIPRKGIARRQSQFPHSCVCEQFIYSHHGSAYSAAGTM
jgi:hypothetical protein